MTNLFDVAEFGVAAAGSFAVAFLAARACLGGLFRVMSQQR